MGLLLWICNSLVILLSLYVSDSGNQNFVGHGFFRYSIIDVAL